MSDDGHSPPRGTAIGALLEGTRRTWHAPAVLVLVWTSTVLAAAPLTWLLRDELVRQLGSSLEAQSAAAGVNYDWMQEFTAQATPSSLGSTFTPTVLGIGAPAENLSALLDRESRLPLVMAIGVLYVALWTFLAGGIIERYGRRRPLRTPHFLWASSVFFTRFLRLGVVSLAVYGILFGWLHPLMFETLYTAWTADVDSERRAFAIRAFLYGSFVLTLAACNIVFDYAKVRAVVEDRRSMLGAVIASMRFIRRNVGAVSSLYLANAAVFWGVLLVYALIAPGAGSIGWSMWLGLAISQLYVAARLWVKLLFWASEVSLFQSRFGHAAYVAAPAVVWPESAAAEALALEPLPVRTARATRPGTH
jgi:hypothetical protein